MDGTGTDILDLGTGSGCLAITLAGELPRARFWAVDRSASALRLARKNARRYGVEKRIIWRKGDYWRALQGRERSQTFDLVLANPPYIAAGDWPSLPAQVRLFEPRLALDGGSGGLDGFRSILAGLPGRLNRPGLMLFEIGADQRSAVEKLCRDTDLFDSVCFHDDYRGRPRLCLGLVQGPTGCGHG